MSLHLTQGEIIGNRYIIQYFLDEGGMQFVYVARDILTNRLVALKTPKNSSAQKRFKRSAVVAAKVNHPNVAKTLDYVRDGERRYLIEELVEGQDLKKSLLDVAPFLDPYIVAKILHHLAKGVAAAHHAGVIHRDLKPTNIMVVGDFSLTELKITDFGIAKMAEEVIQEAIEGGESTMINSATAVGALPYMAPEAIETPESVGSPADIWSVGAMTYHILCGEFPFGQGLMAVPKIIGAVTPNFPDTLMSNPQFRPLASELKEIILGCLRKNPAERPTADQLVERCSKLCYSVSQRHRGEVVEFRFASFGFIRLHDGERVFYHRDSVYGPLPSVGDSVVLAYYAGGGAPRALPVFALKAGRV